MSRYFGKTWWGEQFLNALAHIDFDNRLARGSRYARNGSVKRITIDENTITAKVQGTASRPYTITIVVPPFFEADIKKLIKGIASKPVIVSKLLNRELDPEILHIADKAGVKVFPRKWSDFKMQCSCPDWAVPCKHIAAVIYMVSHEIDNNPFLVFEMHRVNLPEALKKEGIFIQDIIQGEIPVLSKILKGEAKSKKTPRETHETDFQHAYRLLDFSRLTPVGEPLIRLLQEKPPFYADTADFREKYAVIMRRVVKEAQRLLKGKISFDMLSEARNKKKKAKESPSVLSRQYNYYMLLNGTGEASIHGDDAEGVSLADCAAELWRIPHAHLADFQPSLHVLHISLQLAVNLLAVGAVTPRIVQLDNKKFAIRWHPAMLSREVKELTGALKALLPPSILRSGPKNSIERDAEIHLLSCWFDCLLPLMCGKSADRDDIISMFFEGRPQAFKGPAQKEIPGGIQSWLKRFYISQGRFAPVIFVEEMGAESGFLINIKIRLNRNALDEAVPLAEIIQDAQYDAIRFEILQLLGQLSDLVPGLDRYINSGGMDPLIMEFGDFGQFIINAIPVIRLLDIDVAMPKSLQEILRPKVSVKLKKKMVERSGFMSLDKLLDFDWQVAVGDALLDEREFIRLVDKSEGLIRFKTGYMYVDRAEMEKLRKHLSSTRNISSSDLLRIAFAEEYNGAKVAFTDEVGKMIRGLTNQSEIPLPRGLQASLRPYQIRGYSWLIRNSRAGFGSVIADDMGLGKTVQIIAMILKLKEEGVLEKGKVLIVVPTGLLTNWQAELDRFAPGLNYYVYHGAQRALPGKGEKYDLVITSYGTCRSDAEKLKKMKWYSVIIDEAQNIKNSEASQSKAVKNIPASVYIAMSGTPVENNLTELWSIMDFSNRGFLGSVSDFRERYGNPIQFQNDAAAAERLKKVTAPFMLRRLKTDKKIIDDLPDKIEIDTYCNLMPEQASIYEKTLEKAMEQISGIETSDSRSLFIRNGLVLQMILALKQICNHPAQFLKNKALDPMLSGKMDMLFDRLETILESNEKVLVFTQFTEMGDMLKKFISERFGEMPLYYHGGCSVRQRKEMVDAFQKSRADRIFILSLKAGGTGLNLTSANHVIHYDLWWNPAVEAQATDRAYRIGQKNNVMVHRFITRGTFEEKINAMIQKKKNLADMTVATGENWIGNLSNRELRDIFELDGGRTM